MAEQLEKQAKPAPTAAEAAATAPWRATSIGAAAAMGDHPRDPAAGRPKQLFRSVREALQSEQQSTESYRGRAMKARSASESVITFEAEDAEADPAGYIVRRRRNSTSETAVTPSQHQRRGTWRRQPRQTHKTTPTTTPGPAPAPTRINASAIRPPPGFEPVNHGPRPPRGGCSAPRQFQHRTVARQKTTPPQDPQGQPWTAPTDVTVAATAKPRTPSEEDLWRTLWPESASGGTPSSTPASAATAAPPAEWTDATPAPPPVEESNVTQWLKAAEPGWVWPQEPPAG